MLAHACALHARSHENRYKSFCVMSQPKKCSRCNFTGREVVCQCLDELDQHELVILEDRGGLFHDHIWLPDMQASSRHES